MLLSNLSGIPWEGRTARFRCVIALVISDNESELFEGTCDGYVTSQINGMNGFGYDPIFIPSGYKQTFSEMEPKLKMSIDHRFEAYNKIKKFFI